MGKPGSGGAAFVPVNTMKRISVDNTSGTTIEANKRQKIGPTTPTQVYRPSTRASRATKVKDDTVLNHSLDQPLSQKSPILPRREDREDRVDLTHEEFRRNGIGTGAKTSIEVLLPVSKRKQQKLESISDGDGGSPSERKTALPKNSIERDELGDPDDPPPADIRSDLLGKHKRRGPPLPGLQLTKEKNKRPREEQSPDPLSHGSNRLQHVDLVESDAEGDRLSKRNKMTPTKFGGKQGRATWGNIRIPVARAASSNSGYEATSSAKGQLYLQAIIEDGRHTGFEASSDHDDCCPDMAWLSLDPKTLTHIVASPDHLCFVASRSKGFNIPAQLRVEFSKCSDVQRFWECLKNKAVYNRVGIIGTISDQTCRRKLDENMERVASHDQLSIQATCNKDASNSDKLVSEDSARLRNSLPQDTDSRLDTTQSRQAANGASWVADAKSLVGERSSGAKAKLKDQMSLTTSNPQTLETVPKRSLRQQRREPYKEEYFGDISPGLLPDVQDKDRWTVQNPDWVATWDQPLVYPPIGRNRATVDKEDIVRLDEGEFLNDNLINFYLRWLQEQAKDKPSGADGGQRPSVYMFSTFFYEKLRSTGGKYINFDGVKSWTAKIDVFAHDYLLVPVNEHAHWYLAIIYNPSKLLPAKPENPSPEVSPLGRQLSSVTISGDEPPDQLRSSGSDNVNETTRKAEEALKKDDPPLQTIDPKTDPSVPRIITLDSLGNSHVATARALRQYLQEEARHKKSIDLDAEGLALNPKTIPYRASKAAPEQPNFWDCGVYVLEYAKQFLVDPRQRAQQFLEPHVEPAWKKFRSHDLRTEVRQLIFKLHEGQRIEAKRVEAEKQKRKAARIKAPEASEAPIESQIAVSQAGSKKEQTPPVHISEAKANTPSRKTAQRHTKYRIASSMPDSQKDKAQSPEQPSASDPADAALPSPKATATAVVDGAVVELPVKNENEITTTLGAEEEARFIAIMPSSSTSSPEAKDVSRGASPQAGSNRTEATGQQLIELSEDESEPPTTEKGASRQAGQSVPEVRTYHMEERSRFFAREDENDDVVVISQREKSDKTSKGGAQYDGVTTPAPKTKANASSYPDAEC